MSAFHTRAPLPLIAALAAYLLFIGYGSLYPFGEWRAPEQTWWTFLFAAPPRFVTRTDLSTNLLVYLPLGALIAALLAPRMRIRRALLWAFAAGALVSLVMESLQQFIPDRVASNLDMLTNAVGALLGALLFRVVQQHRWPGRTLFGWRERWFTPGRSTDLGLALLALWVLSQFSLELPSLLAGDLHTGFTPYWEALTDFSRVRPERALVYALEIVSLGLFARILLKPGQRMRAVLLGLLAGAVAVKFLAAAVLVKFSVLTRLISFEVLTGLGAGFVALGIVLRRRTDRRPYGLAIASLLALGASKAWWVSGAVAIMQQNAALPGRWFNITGFAGLLSTLWPYVAALYLSGHWIQARRRAYLSSGRSTP
jgi:VanZ family protein